MSNISRVIQHLQSKLSDGTEDSRKTLTPVPANNGDSLYKDDDNAYWRVYYFEEGAVTYEIIKDTNTAHNVAKSFGEFQKLLVDIPGARLNETIVDFHNTPKRYTALEEAIEVDIVNRAKDVKEEIDFIKSRKHLSGKLFDLYKKREIQERICHYYTKLNNLMIDTKTGEGICVIDLDTVMPGFVAFDFGDMIRTSTSPAAEDERDVSKVSMQMHIFKALAKGYLSSAGTFLSKSERETLF